MASYKVPQDVEAEDKLLGPFTFRQFIYLIAAAVSGLLAWGLGQIFIGLVVIPLPVVLFFLILALPLKKDQPMETYLTAVVRFWLKPRQRLWDPEGNVLNVEITALRQAEVSLTKDFSGTEASERLSYLARVVDTGGWATRGLTSATANVNLHDSLVAEAQTAEDIFDSTANVTQNFDTMISRSDDARKQAMMAAMNAGPAQATTPATPSMPSTIAEPDVDFNPYPAAIHQKVISPSGPASVTATGDNKPQASSDDTVSPDIIRLATNKDLSISTIAREAQRLRDRTEGEEVVVSLR